MLAAGIDVFSTVNVQHLESLNDQVMELTGVRVRETVPDSVLGRADEVVLVDLTPEALIGRLRAGRVYPPARVPAALNGFFKVENLAALREVALREVAEEVESKRLVRGAAGGRRRDARGPAGRRTPRPRPSVSGCSPSSRRSRAPSGSSAARGARRSGSAASSTCSTSPATATSPSEAEEASSSRRCAASPWCSAPTCWSRRATTSSRWRGGWRASAAARTCWSGVPRARGPLARLRGALPMRLVEALPGVDIRIVADRTRRRAREDA